jgi:membrane protease YdiL (CAAX protease family)
VVLPRPARSALYPQRALAGSAAAGAGLFIAVVLAVGWIALWLDSFALWIVAPLGAAVLARALARDGADAGLHLRLRGNLPWYGLSVLVPAACVLAVLGLGAAAGGISFAGLTREGDGAFVAAVLSATPWLFLKNIVQEVGWRGYLTPKLRSVGLHDLVNHATVGVVWAIWHIPYYVGILAAGSYDDYTSVELAWFLALLFPGLVAGSIVLGELRLATDSVWPPVIAHTVSNALVFTLLFDDYVGVSSAALFTPGQEGVLIAALCTAAGVAMYVARVRGARGAR